MSVSRVRRSISAVRGTALTARIPEARARWPSSRPGSHSTGLSQGFEQPVDLRVGSDADSQPFLITRVAHQPDQDLAVLEFLEGLAGRRAAGGPDEVGLARGDLMAQGPERPGEPAPGRQDLRSGL